MTEAFKRGLELYIKEKEGSINEKEKIELKMFRTRNSSIDVDRMLEVSLKTFYSKDK